MSYEKNEKSEIIEKLRPQFTKSFAKITCRIQTRIPIALEKSDTMKHLGRFTLRDEGRTIALGVVVKYKPARVMPQVAAVSEDQAKLNAGDSK